jgi:hypothetical protein
MKNPPQRRLQPLAQVLQAHRRNPGDPDMVFDPCIAAASLPLHGRILRGYHAMIVPRPDPAGSPCGRV